MQNPRWGGVSRPRYSGTRRKPQHLRPLAYGHMQVRAGSSRTMQELAGSETHGGHSKPNSCSRFNHGGFNGIQDAIRGSTGGDAGGMRWEASALAKATMTG